MRTQIAAALLALAAPLHAIKITSPAKNDVVDPAAGITVKWSTVSTDPTTAHLVLVNMASGHTPYSKDLGEVDLTKGSFTVTEKDVPNDEGFQFNFESVQTQNTGILAQSEQFEVKAGESNDDDDKTTAKTTSATESDTVKTSTLKVTSTITNSDSTVTSTATTLATVSETASRTGSATESATGDATSSTSTGAAAPTGMVAKGGSLIALVAGVAAVLA